MKKLLSVLAVVGLSGCAVYPAPAYDGYGGQQPPQVVVDQPAYIYGSGVYQSGGARPVYPRAYNQLPPPVVAPYPYPQRPGYRGGDRDRDRDGIPNRFDRDRDGDGVPNQHDSRPYNPNLR